MNTLTQCQVSCETSTVDSILNYSCMAFSSFSHKAIALCNQHEKIAARPLQNIPERQNKFIVPNCNYRHFMSPQTISSLWIQHLVEKPYLSCLNRQQTCQNRSSETAQNLLKHPDDGQNFHTKNSLTLFSLHRQVEPMPAVPPRSKHRGVLHKNNNTQALRSHMCPAPPHGDCPCSPSVTTTLTSALHAFTQDTKQHQLQKWWLDSHTNQSWHLSSKATKTKFHGLEEGQKSLISLSNANSPEQLLAAATASPQVANLVK